MAAPITGRNGRLYVDTSAAANGSAQPVSNLNSFSVNQTSDRTEVTAFGDTTNPHRGGHGRELYNMLTFWANAYQETFDPEIKELDINPFIVGPVGTEAYVADARMTLASESKDGNGAEH